MARQNGRRATVQPGLRSRCRISAEDDRKLLQAEAHAYIGHPDSLKECFAQAQALVRL